MNVIIAHQTFADGDAIGCDIQTMYRVLKNNNFNIFIYCENDFSNSPELQRINHDRVLELVKENSTLLIYHHSIFWETGEKIIRNSGCKVIIRYHNITPPHFFEKYNRMYFDMTKKGREQTERFVASKRFFWMCDSKFNSEEIKELGVNNKDIAILPPFHNLDYLKNIQPDRNILEKLNNEKSANILFTGRVSPNKGHKKILRVARDFKTLFNKKINFWIVGNMDMGLNTYVEELRGLVQKYQIEHIVHFTNKVPPHILKAYFLGCDAFLVLSEHEGFCVPIIEAQFFGLPIIAYQSTAIKETLGENQLIYDQFDSRAIALALDNVLRNKELRVNLINEGIKNYNLRFQTEIIEKLFMNIISKIR